MTVVIIAGPIINMSTWIHNISHNRCLNKILLGCSRLVKMEGCMKRVILVGIRRSCNMEREFSLTSRLYSHILYLSNQATEEWSLTTRSWLLCIRPDIQQKYLINQLDMSYLPKQTFISSHDMFQNPNILIPLTGIVYLSHHHRQCIRTWSEKSHKCTLKGLFDLIELGFSFDFSIHNIN